MNEDGREKVVGEEGRCGARLDPVMKQVVAGATVFVGRGGQVERGAGRVVSPGGRAGGGEGGGPVGVRILGIRVDTGGDRKTINGGRVGEEGPGKWARESGEGGMTVQIEVVLGESDAGGESSWGRTRSLET